MKATEFSARCKAFSGQGVRRHKILVSEDGVVRVYDHIAGHYTRCHSLAASTIKRFLAAAKRLQGLADPGPHIVGD